MSAAFQARGILDAEVFVDLAGRIGTVERVEVDAADLDASRSRHCSVAQWIPTRATALVVVVATADDLRSLAGNAPPNASSAMRVRFSPRGDRHDSRHDGDLDTGELATLAEIVESGLSKKSCVQM